MCRRSCRCSGRCRSGQRCHLCLAVSGASVASPLGAFVLGRPSSVSASAGSPSRTPGSGSVRAEAWGVQTTISGCLYGQVEAMRQTEPGRHGRGSLLKFGGTNLAVAGERIEGRTTDRQQPREGRGRSLPKRDEGPDRGHGSASSPSLARLAQVPIIRLRGSRNPERPRCRRRADAESQDPLGSGNHRLRLRDPRVKYPTTPPPSASAAGNDQVRAPSPRLSGPSGHRNSRKRQ